MGVWSHNDLEVQASTLLIAAIKTAVANAEPQLRLTVSEIAAQIVRDLELLALSAREHD